MQPLSIIIFRNNLRINDNAPLYYASRSTHPVLGLYIVPQESSSHFGFARIGPYRHKFLQEAVDALQQKLHNYGIALQRTFDIDATLQSLSKRHDLTLYFMREVGTEEAAEEKLFRSYSHHAYEGQTLLDPFAFDPYKSFSAFRKKAQNQTIAPPLGLPLRCQTVSATSQSVTANNVIDAGHQRLEAYMPYIHDYEHTRGGFSGEYYATQLSKYLSVGTLSAKEVYWRILQEEERSSSSDGSRWILMELLWRDFFHLVMRQLGPALFQLGGIHAKRITPRHNLEALNAFLEARTGVDIIDAAVTELWATGISSNRSRQLLASYFVKNLGLDWRVGAAWFESLLIDYCPASNYGNWAYQAHVGHDSIYRIFDPEQQSLRYGGADFVLQWLGREERPSLVDYRAMAEVVKQEVFHET
jgi:deoxyribodipyrimidine photo-lyase